MAGIRSRKGRHEVMWYDAEGRQRSKTFPGETPREELEQYHQARLEEARQRRAGPDPLAEALASLHEVTDDLQKVMDRVRVIERSLRQVSKPR